MEIFNLGMGLPCAIRKLLPQQVRRAMRMTSILLTVVCVNVSAHSYEQQTVSFSGKDVPLTAVFKSIEKQTGVSFFYNYSVLTATKPVTIDVSNASVEGILKLALKNQDLDFYIQGKTVFIVKKDKKASVNLVAAIDDSRFIDVKGKVVNDQGQPLAGASVVVRKTNAGTVTDEKGIFDLKNVPANAVIEISYTGYQTITVKVNSQEYISVELTLASSRLDETQVIAYGSTTRRLSVGNIVSVKSEEIERQPVSNLLFALEGRVPGLAITQASGIPGGGVTVRIQGQNSIVNGNDPLYVVDGVPYNSQLLATNFGGIQGSLNGGSPFSYINPMDIERIDILKDADATAIYGSRAANGAILITMKKGKVGETRVGFNVQEGWGAITRKLGLMNTSQYLQMRHEALRNDKITTPSNTDYDINGIWDSTRNTDWQKVLIGGTAQYTSANGTVSGGTPNVQYLIGGTYQRQTAVFPGNFADQKGSLLLNLTTVSNNQRFKTQLSANYLIDDNRLPGSASGDLTNKAIILAPDAPPLYNANGSLNWAPTPTGTSSWTNPLAVNFDVYENKANNLVSNAILSYRLLSGLEIKSSFGYTRLQMNETDAGPLIAIAPEKRPTSKRSAYFTYNTTDSWIVEPQLNYKATFGRHKLDVLIGSTIEQNDNNGANLFASGFNSDAVLKDIHSASSVTVNSSQISTYKYAALFGRVNYVFSGKYILDFTARRDGSSRFGSANQFHNFGSVGAAWDFSEENAIKNHLEFLSFGKLRASYGTTGNDQISDYQFLNLYTPVTAAVAYQGATGLVPNGLPNPYLEWEQTKKLQGGVDLGFLRDRILLNGTYVYNRSSNQLLRYALPVFVGFGSILENFPATVQNKEWEFSLNTINVRSKNFTWTSSINLTIPQNKVVSFPNIALSTYASGTNGVVIGKPVGIKKVFHFNGVNPATGAYEFFNSHNADTSTPNALTDERDYISTLPRYYGGFQNSFTYKGLQLDFLFQFVEQLGSNYVFGNIPGYPNNNEPVNLLKRWQYPGQVTTIQRYNSNLSLFTSLNDAKASNAAYSDASYIRLKNISLSYAFPSSFIRKAHLQMLKVFLLGQNLLTFTSFKGMDPETQSVNFLPPLKVLTAGIQVEL